MPTWDGRRPVNNGLDPRDRWYSPEWDFEKDVDLKVADFLFPRDLDASGASFRRVLFIGSCLSEAYTQVLQEKHPDQEFHHILFNNASDLPHKEVEELDLYDLQYIQLPLRSVLTDAIVRHVDSERSEHPIDWIELGQRNIDAMLDKVMAYNLKSGLLTIISNFIVPQGMTAPSLIEQGWSGDISHIVARLNTYLATRVSDFSNCYLADVEMIAASLGKSSFLDDYIYFWTHGAVVSPMWAHHEMDVHWTRPEAGRIEPVPAIGDVYHLRIDEYYEAIHRQIEVIWRISRQIDSVKLVIFDLDNTMWRGLLGDHYGEGQTWPHVDNWPTGLWEAVQVLRRRGIIVSIASKNDAGYVESRWGDVTQFGFVKFDDFTSPRINWQPKAGNIGEIIDLLSLTPKSVVFVDDNPVEREAVKAAFPDIRTIGSNPFVTRRVLLWAPEMQIPSRNDVTLRRENMLRQQVEREKTRVSLSREEFLQSLGCEIKWIDVDSTDHPNFPRVSELVNKTNQFNTDGQRWAMEDYRRHWDQGGRVFAFQVKDRYTEYGLVGVIFVHGDRIVQYVMSCRVLGMEVEVAAVALAVAAIRSTQSGDAVSGRIVETASNMPCRDVYLKSGFEAGEGGEFLLPPDAQLPIPAHISIVEA